MLAASSASTAGGGINSPTSVTSAISTAAALPLYQPAASAPPRAFISGPAVSNAAHIAALESELESRKALIEQLQNDRLQQLRTMNDYRVEEENKRQALITLHRRELEALTERSKSIASELEAEAQRTVAAERRRVEDTLGRVRVTEEGNDKLHHLLAQKQLEIQDLLRKVAGTEQKLQDVTTEKANEKRTFEGRVQALDDLLDARGRELEDERRKVATGAARLESMKAMMGELNQKCSQHEVESGRRDISFGELSREKDRLESVIAHLEGDVRAEKQRYQDLLAAGDDRDQRKDTDVAKLRDEIRRLQQVVSHMEVDARQRDETNRSVVGEKDRLARELLESERRSEQLQDSLATAKDTVRDLQASVAKTGIEVQGLQRHIGELKHDRDELQASRDSTDALNQQLRKDLDGQGDELRRVAFLEEQIRQLRLQLERADKDIDNERRRSADATDRLEHAEVTIAQQASMVRRTKELEIELQLRQEQSVQLSGRHEQQQVVLSDLRSQLDQARSTFDGERRQRDAAEAAANDWREKAEVLERQCASLTVSVGRVSALEAAVNSRTKELTDAVEEVGYHKQRIVQLENDLTQISTLEHALKASHDERMSQLNVCHSLEDAVAEKDKALNRRDNEIADRIAENSALRSQIDHLEGDLRLANGRAAEVVVLTGRIRDLERAVQDKSTEFSVLAAKEGEARMSLLNMKQELEVMQIHAQDVSTRLDSTAKQLEAAQIEIGRRTVQAETADRACKKADHEASVARERATKAHADATELRQSLEQLTATCDTIQKESEDRQRELSTVTRGRALAEATIAELNRAVEDRDARLKEVELAHTELKNGFTKSTILEGKITALEKLNAAGNLERQQLELQLRDRNSTIVQLEAEASHGRRSEQRLAEIKLRVSSLSDELEAKDAELSAKSMQIVERDTQIGKLRDLLASEEQTSRHTQQRLHASSSDVHRLEGEVRRLSAVDGELAGVKELLTQRNMAVSSLTTTIEDQRAAINRLQEQIDGLKHVLVTNAGLESQLAAKRAAVDELQAELTERSGKATTLEMELLQCRGQIARITKELDDARSARDGHAVAESSLRAMLEQDRHAFEEEKRALILEANTQQALAEDCKMQLNTDKHALKRVSDHCQALEADVLGTRRRLEAADTEKGHLLVDFDILRASHDELKQTVAHLTSSLAAEKSTSDKANKQASEHRAITENLTATLAKERGTHDQDLQRFNRLIEELKLQVQEKSKMLHEKSDHIDRMSTALKFKDEELRSAFEESASLKAQLSSTQAIANNYKSLELRETERRRHAETAAAESDATTSVVISRLQATEKRLVEQQHLMELSGAANSATGSLVSAATYRSPPQRPSAGGAASSTRLVVSPPRRLSTTQ